MPNHISPRAAFPHKDWLISSTWNSSRGLGRDGAGGCPAPPSASDLQFGTRGSCLCLFWRQDTRQDKYHQRQLRNGRSVFNGAQAFNYSWGGGGGSHGTNSGVSTVCLLAFFENSDNQTRPYCHTWLQKGYQSSLIKNTPYGRNYTVSSFIQSS